MGILENFKHLEERRIERLFDIVERFAAEEVDTTLKSVFEVYAEQGFMGRAVLDALKTKIGKACGMQGVKLSDIDFLSEFYRLDDSKKRCLLVTVANDCCKLGVLQETDVVRFLEAQLAKTPGAATNAGPKSVKHERRM